MDNKGQVAAVEKAPAEACAQNEYNPAPYLAALSKLERNSQHNLNVCRIIVALAILLLVPWVVLAALEKSDAFYLYIVAFFLVMDAIPAFFPNMLTGAYVNKIEEQFAHFSRLVQMKRKIL